MQPLHVASPEGIYPIHLAEGLLAEAGRLLQAADLGGSCAVVTNPTIGQHYARPLLDSLRAAGFQPTRCDIPDGEAHKTLETVAGLYDRFVAAGLDRRSPVIALGGGVVGDVAGFAAASFLRGLPFVQIPTTLLAMVDSSVGGKVGVDLPQGKNLVGAFKQPELVIIDPAVLKTLPAVEFRAGLAEVIKHAIIASPELFEALGSGNFALPWMIHEAVQVKVVIVEEDPFEQGRRAVLNLGHTFAHAFEQLSAYRLRHGEAVAMGLVCAAHLAADLGHCSPQFVEAVTGLLEHVELPVSPPPYPPAEVWAAMRTDKKRRGKTVRFVLPRGIGDVAVFNDVPQSAVDKVLTSPTT
ncbi:MAG: 3-dehydroquinate synthase [Anaerolineae bacterium]